MWSCRFSKEIDFQVLNRVSFATPNRFPFHFDDVQLQEEKLAAIGVMAAL
jgi:hypothetical protein